MAFDDLDPGEFENTAKALIAACETLPGTRERAAALGEAGLIGVIAPESVGGLGLSLRFAVPILQAAGAGLLRYPLIENMLLSEAFARQAPDIAGGICSGELVATIAWDDKLPGSAPLAQDADYALIFRGPAAHLIPAEGFKAAPMDDVLDLERPEYALHLNGVEGIMLDPEATCKLQRKARIMRAALILGSGEACLQLACEHAQERQQFGRPLSANQAIRHRLSRDCLAMQSIKNALTRVIANGSQTKSSSETALCIAAGELGTSVAESAIQVLGGMGFTWEIPLHRHLRQILTQAAQARVAEMTDALGEALLNDNSNQWYKDLQHVE